MLFLGQSFLRFMDKRINERMPASLYSIAPTVLDLLEAAFVVDGLE